MPMLSSALQVGFGIVYLALGLLQFFIGWTALEIWLGVHSVVALLLALLVAWFPLLGTLIGIFGTPTVMGWSIWAGVAIFVGPMLVPLALAGVMGIVELAKSAKQPS